MKIYDELVDFFAAGTTSQKIANFKASEETQLRVKALLDAQKDETATSEEL